MEAVFLLVLLLCVLALNWRFLGLPPIAKGARTPRAFSFGRPCRWRRDPTRAGAEQARYTCATCGVEAYTSDGREPNRCKRAVRDAGH